MGSFESARHQRDKAPVPCTEMNAYSAYATRNPCTTAIGGTRVAIVKANAEKLLTRDTEHLSATVAAMKDELTQLAAKRTHEPTFEPMNKGSVLTLRCQVGGGLDR